MWPSWAERDRLWSRRLHRAATLPWVVLLMIGVSRVSDGLIWYAFVAGLPFLGGPQGGLHAFHMLLLGTINLSIYKLVKARIARPRPYIGCPGIRALTRSLDEYSFPSGHTLHAAAYSLLLSAWYPSLAAVLWPFTLLVALSRVVLGLHYPSDVVMGAALGLVTAGTCLTLI